MNIIGGDVLQAGAISLVVAGRAAAVTTAVADRCLHRAVYDSVAATFKATACLGLPLSKR